MQGNSYFERLSQCLKILAERLGGFQNLQDDISNELKAGRWPLSRRQLSKLCHGKDFGIKVATWEAIDHYLQIKWSMSLAQIWSNRSVLQELSAAQAVAFIIGSQPDRTARRIDLSRWDIRAMRDVLNQISMIGQTIQVIFEDVIYRGAHINELRSGNVPENEAWFHLLGHENGPAVVCLGSPKANHCAEVLLARMFGVNPFQTWPEGLKRPFGFIWPHGDPRGDEIQSCVRLDPFIDAEEILKLEGKPRTLLPMLQDEKSQTLAMVIGGEIHPVRRKGSKWDSYSIVAARRIGKRTHVCVAGLTGPATLGAARLLRHFAPQLQQEMSPGSSRTAWMVVRTPVIEAKKKSFRSDERRALDSEIVGTVRYWPAV